ncbi:MAG: pantoate--beta-alanine ligase [Gammaproteobacteria bacterium]
MQTVYDLTGLRKIIVDWKRQGLTVAFVPTMGNLHGGHLSLLQQARELADRSVVSIFVNPIQFGKGEDYERYPSTLDEDKQKLAETGLDLLFAPDLDQLYPGGIDADTRVTVPDLSNILCGKFRPIHFSGVATVVTKLLINVQPDVALFGEKDYQQLLVIRRMVRDLCMPVEIVGVPIMREKDGLAMSSRNNYLSRDERKKAPLIYKTLQAAAQRLRRNPGDITAIEAEAILVLESAGFRPEYFSVRRSDDLGEPHPHDRRFSILTAAWLGKARLLDNLKVSI